MRRSIFVKFDTAPLSSINLGRPVSVLIDTRDLKIDVYGERLTSDPLFAIKKIMDREMFYPLVLPLRFIQNTVNYV